MRNGGGYQAKQLLRCGLEIFSNECKTSVSLGSVAVWISTDSSCGQGAHTLPNDGQRIRISGSVLGLQQSINYFNCQFVEKAKNLGME
jgi:hypothetical protein